MESFRNLGQRLRQVSELEQASCICAEARMEVLQT